MQQYGKNKKKVSQQYKNMYMCKYSNAVIWLTYKLSLWQYV